MTYKKVIAEWVVNGLCQLDLNIMGCHICTKYTEQYSDKQKAICIIRVYFNQSSKQMGRQLINESDR